MSLVVLLKGLRRTSRLRAGLALGIYAFALLSIGLDRDWRLRHEDNGAMHTSLALSHQRLGLARTRAHDLFLDPRTGEARPYGHHPPATALFLAGAFSLTGADVPAIARLTVILFHLGSLFLTVKLLGLFFDPRRALLGGFVMATLPMSTYFGRMVNYEPLCLFAILLQLYGYARYKLGGRFGSTYLATGIVLGGLIDWPSFFFAAAIAAVELVDLLRRRASSIRLLALLVVLAPAVFVFDLWHLWYAGRGGVEALGGVLSANRPMWEQEFTLTRFFLGQLDTFRRYFTHVGLLSILVALLAMTAPRWEVTRGLFNVAHAHVVKRTLLAAGIAAVAYLLAAPSWAMAHQYWQFFFLPAVVLSIMLAWGLLERGVRTRKTRILRVLRVVCILDLLISSAYWLHFRHTRVEAYAIETTAMYRSRFLAPQQPAAEADPAEQGR